MVSIAEISPVHHGVTVMEYSIFHSISNNKPSAFCVNLILLIIEFMTVIKSDVLKSFSKFNSHLVNLFSCHHSPSI